MPENSAIKNPASIIAGAAFAAFLATFLNVGFSPIMADLGADVSTVQWLATAYMLGAAVMVPVSAFAYRSFPTRPLFCATTALLVVGSVVAGLAQNFAVLLAGRIVQALGTGMLIPIGMNITLEVAPREKLGTYMGIVGAMTTLGPSSSVILAGLILAVADWHMLLWTFAALSALCLLAGAVLLRDVATLTHPHLDAASVALVGIALVGILYGISTVFGGAALVAAVAFAVGVVALVLFVRRQRTLDEPLIDLRPLSIRPFAVGVVVNMLSLMTIFAMNIIVPTFMQSVLGVDSLTASLTLFPAILCSCGVSPVAGRIFDKHGPGVLLPLGFACIAVFSVLTSVFIAFASPVVLALLYTPVICGSALVIGPVQSFALSKLSFAMNPHGVTVMSTGFQIAGCIGSSVFTGVYSAAVALQSSRGVGLFDACSFAMTLTGVLVGAVGVVGFALALVIRSMAKRGDAAQEALADARGASDPSVATIMKREVYQLKSDDLLTDAMQLFIEKGISGAPVVDASGKLVGFISDGDVMLMLADQIPAFKSAWSFIVEAENSDFDVAIREAMATPVARLAAKNVICVNATDDLGAVTRLLATKHLKKAPVLEGGEMVGIINRSNIASYAVKRFVSGKA